MLKKVLSIVDPESKLQLCREGLVFAAECFQTSETQTRVSGRRPLHNSRASGSHSSLKTEACLVFGLFAAVLLSACPSMSDGTLLSWQNSETLSGESFFCSQAYIRNLAAVFGSTALRARPPQALFSSWRSQPQPLQPPYLLQPLEPLPPVAWLMHTPDKALVGR